MKKLFLSALFAAASLCANAVDMSLPGAGATRFGVEAGLNESSFRMDHNEFLTGFSFGVKVEHNISDNLFIDGQFNFARKGSVATASTVLGKTEKDCKLSYLQLNAGVGYRFALNSKFGLAPHVGLFYGYGVASELEDSDNEPFADLDYNKSDFGFDLGLNFDLGKNFQFGAGVELGMLQLHDDGKFGGYTYSDCSDMKSVSWYQRFTYFF